MGRGLDSIFTVSVLYCINNTNQFGAMLEEPGGLFFWFQVQRGWVFFLTKLYSMGGRTYHILLANFNMLVFGIEPETRTPKATTTAVEN